MRVELGQHRPRQRTDSQHVIAAHVPCQQLRHDVREEQARAHAAVQEQVVQNQTCKHDAVEREADEAGRRVVLARATGR